MLCTRWQVFTSGLADGLAVALDMEGEDRWTDQAMRSRLVDVCGRAVDFCQLVHRAGFGWCGRRRSPQCALSAPQPDRLVLDVVHDNFVYLEVQRRPPLCRLAD